MSTTQKERLIRITTPLGEEVFMVLSFSGTEFISKLYSFDLRLASTYRGITFDQLGGKNVTVTIRINSGAEYYFNGIIVEFEPSGDWENEGLSTYRARMVPAVWVLNQWIDSRIFQYKSVPSIIEAIFAKASLGAKGVKQSLDFRMELSNTYTVREYCEQYNESDFAFISRLCESEGIFYFFEHENGAHTIVFTDDADRAKQFAPGGKRTVTFRSAPTRLEQPRGKSRSHKQQQAARCKIGG